MTTDTCRASKVCFVILDNSEELKAPRGLTEPEAIAEIKEIRATLEYAAHEAHTGLQDHMDHEEIKEIRVTLAYAAYEAHAGLQDL